MSQFREPWKLSELNEVEDSQGNPAPDYPEDCERVVAAVNFCRQFPTEFLQGRQLVYVKDKENIKTAADIQ